MTEDARKFETAIAKNGADAIRPRQDPLMALYKDDAGPAQIIDSAVTRSATAPAGVAFYSEVVPNKGGAYPIGVHKAVGGLSDFATPGDLLCAAIAACLDSTIRIIANRMGVPLKELEVAVSGHVDVRGTLRVEESVPVGFQRFDIDVTIEPAVDMPDAYLEALVKGAEQSCVVLQTLQRRPDLSLARHPATSEQKTAA